MMSGRIAKHSVGFKHRQSCSIYTDDLYFSVNGEHGIKVLVESQIEINNINDYLININLHVP